MYAVGVHILLKVLNLGDEVGGEGELLAVDEDVEGALHLLDGRVHANQFNLLRLGRLFAAGLLPLFQRGFNSGWHFI